MKTERMANRSLWTLLAAGLLLYASLLPQAAAKKDSGVSQLPVWTDGTAEKLGQAVRMFIAPYADAPGNAASLASSQRFAMQRAVRPSVPADGTIAVSLRLAQLEPLKFASNYVIGAPIRHI